MRSPHRTETSWKISGSSLEAEVQGENWLVALGYALEADGNLSSVQQIACERLVNGSVIVNDIQNRRRYRVQQSEE